MYFRCTSLLTLVELRCFRLLTFSFFHLHQLWTKLILHFQFAVEFHLYSQKRKSLVDLLHGLNHQNFKPRPFMQYIRIHVPSRKCLRGEMFSNFMGHNKFSRLRGNILTKKNFFSGIRESHKIFTPQNISIILFIQYHLMSFSFYHSQKKIWDCLACKTCSASNLQLNTKM